MEKADIIRRLLVILVAYFLTLGVTQSSASVYDYEVEGMPKGKKVRIEFVLEQEGVLCDPDSAL